MKNLFLRCAELLRPCAHLALATPMLLGALGCQQRTAVALMVKGLTRAPGALELRVSVQRGGEKAVALPPFTREALGLKDGDDQVTLGLDLPSPEAAGALSLTVAAVDPALAFVLADGKAEGLALRPGRNDAEVTLARRDLCTGGGWCWELPTPSGRQMHALWGSAPDDLWAAGAFGTLLHYDGSFWSPASLPDGLEPDLYALWGSGHDDVWAVGGALKFGNIDYGTPRGAVLHFDGERWSAVPGLPPLTAVVLGVAGAAPGEVWVSGRRSREEPFIEGGKVVRVDRVFDEGFLLRCRPAGCDDAPVLFSQLLGNRPSKDSGPLALWAPGDAQGTLWAAGQYYEEVSRTNQGVLLRRRTGEDWRIVAKMAASMGLSHLFGSGEELWAGGLQEARPFYIDAPNVWRAVAGSEGAQWEAQTQALPGGMLPPMPLLEDREGTRWGIDRQSVKPARRPGRAGGAWTVADQAMTARSLLGTTAGDVWAAGEAGTVLRLDATLVPQAQSLPLRTAQVPFTGGAYGKLPKLEGMYALNSHDVWAVGEAGTILHYDGGAWARVDSGTAQALQAVFGVPEGLWAAGRGGALLRWRDGAWVKEAAPVADLFDLWGTGSGDLWAVGRTGDGKGVILRWQGDRQGGAWTQAMVTGGALYGITGSGATRWAVGCSGVAGASPGGVLLEGGAWREVAPYATPDDRCFYQAWIERDGVLWAHQQGSVFQRYTVATGKWDGNHGGNTIGRCAAVGAGDLWCPQSAGYLARGNISQWTPFPVDGEGDLSHLYSRGSDFWLFGRGIVHCTRGLGCAPP